MRVDPQIAALRGGHTSQCNVQKPIAAQRDAWLRRPANAAIMDGLAEFSKGCPLDRLPELRELARSADAASRFVAEWCDLLAAAAREQMLAEVPFRYTCSNGYSAVRLMSAGCASVSVLAYEEDGNVTEPTSAFFVDRELYEIVIAGSAIGLSHRLENHGKRPVTRRLRWQAGDLVETLGANQSRQITSIAGRLCILQLAREKPGAVPTREISLEDGRVLHVSSGDKTESQTEMALAVLGAMRRMDAVPVMEQISRKGSPHLRWQAVRHAIALDPHSGFGLLTRLASNPNDELAEPARNLRTQLAAAHPQLLKQEGNLCPA